MKGTVFRKSALDRIASPEQLDTLVQVTTSRGWLALATLILIVALGLVWSVFGTITTSTSAEGVIIKTGGIIQVQHVSDGRLTRILVGPKDYIEKGQIVATIEQFELATLLDEEIHILGAIDNAFASAESESDRRTAQARRSDQARHVRKLERSLEYYSNIRSPTAGKVIDIMVTEGMFVSAGSTIVTVEPQTSESDDLIAVLYVPSRAKGIKPGMAAQISPATFKKEEYGLIRASVVTVSEYPATFQGMMTAFGNEIVVQSLLQQGPVFQVEVELEKSSKTASGYLWTTADGPIEKLTSGTLCKGTIIEGSQSPIQLAIPLLQRSKEK
jgi:biotin carboxyl carrier protein